MAKEQRLPLLFRIPPGSEPVAYDNWRKIMDLARLVNHIDGQINAPQSGIAALGFKTKWNEHDTTAGYLSDKLVAGSNVTFTVAHEYGDAAMTISVHNPVTLATNSGLSLSTQVLAMGTPSTLTTITTNAVSISTHTHAITGFEPALGNPAGDGYALISTALGVRSWAAVTAAAIPNVPAGNISSVTVQNAIYELDLEKEPIFVYATSFPGSPVDKQVCVRTDLNGDLVTSSGATTFLGLTDTPSSYAGSGSKWLAVNAGADAIEFVTAPEPALGNPGTNGYVLASTTAGVRSWVAQSGGSGGAGILECQVFS
jgi:hypothetical protein